MGYELSLGLYPGVLFGIRSYQINDKETDHLMYLPLIYFCLTVIKE
jgi:hypothetical protein